MDKHPKIVKRQRAGVISSKTSSMPTGESLEVEANESVESAQPAPMEQFFEPVEPHPQADTESAIDSSPLPYNPGAYYPAVSHWFEELREISCESDLDVWESCPYD